MPRSDELTLSLGAFPEGAARYQDGHPDFKEDQPRIYVKFRPAAVDFSFWALLDTGAHFCRLNETVVGFLGGHLADSLGRFTVRTAYGLVEGQLYRHQITLLADVGQSVDIDATVLIPPEWRGPCFLGYAGALDHVHFGINPWRDQFSFSAPQ